LCRNKGTRVVVAVVKTKKKETKVEAARVEVTKLKAE
jgi:hypothetical protein